MNSPFTREEQMVARDLHRIANNLDALCDKFDRVINLLEKQIEV